MPKGSNRQAKGEQEEQTNVAHSRLSHLQVKRQIHTAEISSLKPNPKNSRTHSKKQIQQIAASIRQFGFNNPILIDAAGMIVAGHGRLEAAKILGLQSVPTLSVDHLSDVEKRAFMLADNKIAELAGWDLDILAVEFEELSVEFADLEIDLECTGFATGEIDQIVSDHDDRFSEAVEDELPEPLNESVSKRGDVWCLGSHRLLCGDARSREEMITLLGKEEAALVITDPPYNVKVNGHVGGRGRTKHQEFAFASGEMSADEYRHFLRDSVTQLILAARPGALIYCFIDWRHIEVLLAAGRELELSLSNVCIWHKSTPGQGSFYRSSHEMIAVFAVPGAKTTNNIQLGKFGRNRSNVWSFAGVNTFQTGEGDDLVLHPTVKPITMIAEAIKDASKRGEIVLDSFLGSGTTLLAAEKVGRRCYGIEYEPMYIDTAIRRWQQMTGKDAILVSRPSSSSLDSIPQTLKIAEARSFNELRDQLTSANGGDDEQ